MRGALAVSVLLGISIGAATAANAQPTEQPGFMPIVPALTVGKGTAPSTYGWAGTWFSNSYVGGYAGLMRTLNKSNNLWDDGFFIRFDSTGGSYNYSSVSYGSADVGMWTGDLMLGYRKRIDTTGTLSVSLGPAFEYHNNPDPAADIRGTEVGAKILAEYSSTIDQNFQVNLQGSFATPFSVYAASGRVLYQVVDKVWVGPQATLYGNNAPYQEGTFGAFVKVDTEYGEFGVSGGYRRPFTSGDPDGYFASLFFGLPIQ